MKRLSNTCAIVAALLALAVGAASAEVKTREKTHAKLEGVIGGVVNFFGGKAAKEGVVSTAAVKGNRKATMNESSGQIIDLTEEKVYDLDMKKKTYEVTTFDELRRRMKEARDRAAKEASKPGRDQGKEEKPNEPQKELQVDFDVKETGQKKQLATYDTREVIMTISVHEKGKAIEDAGGFVMTADSWLGPQIPALKELAAFDVKYFQQLQGPEAVGMSAEQMATIVAMYPAVKQATDRLSKEGGKLQGTPLATTTTFEAVKSKEQMTQQPDSATSSSASGGLGGMLARRMAKKDAEPKGRTLIFTTEHEFQDVSTTVSAADLDIPAGFKEKK
ncbi:MAG: hypothetical protein ABJC89_02685 [Acidobacteriota bacterium]